MKKLLTLLLVLSGCGYHLTGSETILPQEVRRISIPFVENDTVESRLSTIMTESLRDSFERYGVVEIVDSDSEADAILKVRVVELRGGSQSVSSKTDTELQKSLTLVLSGELRRVNGPVLWRNNKLEVKSSYAVTSDVVATSSSSFAGGTLNANDLAGLGNREVSRGQQQQALEQVAADASKVIYDAAVAPDF